MADQELACELHGVPWKMRRRAHCVRPEWKGAESGASAFVVVELQLDGTDAGAGAPVMDDERDGRDDHRVVRMREPAGAAEAAAERDNGTVGWALPAAGMRVSPGMYQGRCGRRRGAGRLAADPDERRGRRPFMRRARRAAANGLGAGDAGHANGEAAVCRRRAAGKRLPRTFGGSPADR
ncbi:TPA: hypothetical protein QDB44_000489 [Burkholderia vietnamiensis]|nr:hypothetical protein [Burkholderia vietnamiensis]